VYEGVSADFFSEFPVLGVVLLLQLTTSNAIETKEYIFFIKMI
jgi:hypothetical protein